MPPNCRLSGFFNGKKPALLGLFSLPEVFCGPQICQKCVGGRGSAPDPTGGAQDAPPNLLVGWGGGHPLPNLHPSPIGPFGPRFSRLRLSASVPPQCKILATPLACSLVKVDMGVCASCQRVLSHSSQTSPAGITRVGRGSH